MNIKGVVFDWAGTIVDFGSLAPMGAFVELFGRYGVSITIEEARTPMGLPKLEHIRMLGSMPSISQQWQQRHGRIFGDADARLLLQEFEPMSAEAALARADFIPGLLETQSWLQRHEIRIATTTGYTRRIMTPIIASAHQRGFIPEQVICCDDVERSRPDPMGMRLCIQSFGLEGQAQRVIKVDDTEPGLAEGRNAGCWTVGVAASGNALGWNFLQWKQASVEQRSEALNRASQALLDAGADEVIPTVAELPHALIRIDQRMSNGDRPGN